VEDKNKNNVEDQILKKINGYPRFFLDTKTIGDIHVKEV
jgi:hypothetical protein